MTSNHDLHIMLTEMRGDIKALLQNQNGMNDWQEEHDKKDSERFTKLHERIDGLNKYAASIAIVAGAIGACGTWLWNKITGA